MTDGDPNKPYFMVSPDGPLRDISENETTFETSTKVGIEIKKEESVENNSLKEGNIWVKFVKFYLEN